MCERPNDDLLAAAKALAKVLPDVVLESLRSEWGHTNVAVITHWGGMKCCAECLRKRRSASRHEARGLRFVQKALSEVYEAEWGVMPRKKSVTR